MLAQEDLFGAGSGGRYRLTDTGQGLQRVRSCFFSKTFSFLFFLETRRQKKNSPLFLSLSLSSPHNRSSLPRASAGRWPSCSRRRRPRSARGSARRSCTWATTTSPTPSTLSTSRFFCCCCFLSSAVAAVAAAASDFLNLEPPLSKKKMEKNGKNETSGILKCPTSSTRSSRSAWTCLV